MKNKPKQITISVKKYATGGQLKAQNNAGMNPYLYNSLPQYGLGSWLGENAGTIGTVAGWGLGAALAPFTGGASLLAAGSAGSMIGGALGGAVQKGHERNDAEQLQQQQLAQQQQQVSVQNAMENYKAQEHPMYGTNFATGGFMPNVNTWQYSNVGGINYACGGKMANGGQLGNDNGAAQMTKGLDNVTVYANGGTHEQNSNGGIPIGKKGLVEQGEVRWKNYIFSNKF